MNSYKQSLYVGLIRVMANLLMLGAVFLSMYRASQWSSWPSEAVFCCWFFGHYRAGLDRGLLSDAPDPAAFPGGT